MKNYNKQQVCNRCVMDTSAEDIVFDENGVCNYCKDFLLNYSKLKEKNKAVKPLIDKIKKDGKNKEYDCIIGVSGGLDSSYLLYLAKEWGLRPLATHMDNGWDTELASANISNLVNKLDVDLYTYVIDWEEYRELMLSFFNADVIDIEMLYDNALLGVNYRQAAKYKVKYMITGGNYATEGVMLPHNWRWQKIDGKNIRSIHKKFNGNAIKSFPLYTIWNYIYHEYIRNIKRVRPLDYIDYKKDEALKVLTEKFDYKPYKYKHYESVFTRFYQGYILPKKWGIDKRKVHLSNLILTGQMTRDEAIDELKKEPYPSEEELQEDKEYVLKKLNWNEKQLQDYINSPGKNHSDYGTDRKIYNFIRDTYQKFFE